MSEKLFEAQYDITKKSRLKKFYEAYKILIFSSVLILLIAIASVSYYSQAKEKKKILLAENYLTAKIYLDNGDRNRATSVLKEEGHPTHLRSINFKQQETFAKTKHPTKVRRTSSANNL